MIYMRILALVAATLLAGCFESGGSSSGGGVNVTQNPGPVDIARVAGQYRGSARITVSALLLDESETFSVRVTISSSRRIEIVFSDDLVAEGPLAANGSFTISDSLRDAGVDCDGTLTITGSVNAAGTQVLANIRSSGGECEGVSARAVGSLTANRT